MMSAFKHYGQSFSYVPLEEIELGMVAKSLVTGNYGIITKVAKDFVDGGRKGFLKISWMNGNISAGYYYDEDYGPKDNQHFSNMLCLGSLSDLDKSNVNLT